MSIFNKKDRYETLRKECEEKYGKEIDRHINKMNYAMYEHKKDMKNLKDRLTSIKDELEDLRKN